MLCSRSKMLTRILVLVCSVASLPSFAALPSAVDESDTRIVEAFVGNTYWRCMEETVYRQIQVGRGYSWVAVPKNSEFWCKRSTVELASSSKLAGSSNQARFIALVTQAIEEHRGAPQGALPLGTRLPLVLNNAVELSQSFSSTEFDFTITVSGEEGTWGDAARKLAGCTLLMKVQGDVVNVKFSDPMTICQNDKGDKAGRQMHGVIYDPVGFIGFRPALCEQYLKSKSRAPDSAPCDFRRFAKGQSAFFLVTGGGQ